MSTALAEFDRDMFDSPTAEEQSLINAGKARRVFAPNEQDWRLEILPDVPVQAAPEPAPVAPVTRDPFENGPKPQEPTPAPQKPAQAPAKKARTNKAGNAIPRPEVPYRQPDNQNEHFHAVCRLLRKHAQHVALIAHHEIGIEHRSNFCGGKRELSAEFLATKTGLSPNKAREAMAEAVKAGLFVRVDNGNGGRNSKNRATYMAIVPDLDPKPSTVKGPRGGDTSLVCE